MKRDRVPTVEIPVLTMEELARERMSHFAAEDRRTEALRTPILFTAPTRPSRRQRARERRKTVEVPLLALLPLIEAA